MACTRIYVATSADGFIADADGSVEWLASFDPLAYGYESFSAQVGSVILGRRTYEFTQAFGDWPYGDKQAFILTSQELWDLPDNAVFVRTGIEGALKAARNATNKDVWIVGGAATMQAALELGEVDSIELFVVPILLGSGLPLLSQLDQTISMALEGIETYQDGVVKLAYRPLNRRR